MSQMPPWQETLLHLSDRKVISKDGFLSLPDELRMRAFTIARQTSANILQDTLSALHKTTAEGGTLWDFKQNFPEILAPYTEAGRDWHLELVFNQNVRQAQAVGAYQARQRVKRAFPYVQYHAGPNPRPAHAVLDGMIFDVDDEFLHSHTPPWDYGCNCDLIARTAAQVGVVQSADQDRPLEKQRVVPGNAQLKSLVDSGHLPDPQLGALHPVDVRPANERPGNDGYSFRPDRLNQTLDLSGYEPDLRARLAEQLADFGYRLSDDGLTAVPMAPPPPPTASRAAHSLISVLKAAPARISRSRQSAARLSRPVSHLATPPRHNAPVTVGRPAARHAFTRRAA